MGVFFREFSLDALVEMPNRISSLGCITHRVKVKVSGSLRDGPDAGGGPTETTLLLRSFRGPTAKQW